MKKIIILLSLVAFAGCSLLPDKESEDNEAIAAAEQKAKNNISVFTDQEIIRAKTELRNTVSSAINKVDTTLIEKLQQVESSLNTKAEEMGKELNSKISMIEGSIDKAKAIGFMGIAIGLIGIIIATVACQKRPRTNINTVKNIILEEINSNDLIRTEIRNIIDGQKSSSRSQITAQSDSVEHIIETYLRSEKFKNIIQKYINKNTYVSPDAKNETETNKRAETVYKTVCQFFAKESNTMILSNIQDTYQKGKSIFKLTLLEPNATTAEVSICVEKEEVKQRILKYDSQYIEPICTVIRSSYEPTEVVIKSTGVAERNGDDWQVIKPITVELK